MKFKKSIVFLLSLCLLFSNVSIVHAAETMSFSVGSCEASPGETVSIPISINHNTGFVSMSLSVTYDTSALTLISYEDTGIIGGASHSSHFTSPYVLTWENDTRTSNITATGTVIYLTFLVSEYAAEQNYSVIVRIPTDGILDAEGSTVDASSAMGTITVSAEHECSFGNWEKYNSKKHVRHCDDCDEKEYANHIWNDGEIIEEPSHDAEGEIEYTCEDCGATKSAGIDVVPHSYGKWTKYNSEQHKRSCSCGEVEYEKHDWDDGVITKAPTATASGTMTYTCTLCNATREESIPPTTHTHTYTLYQVVPPTCQSDGYTIETCSACGSERKVNYVPTVSHQYVGGACTYCGAIDPGTSDTIPVTGITLSESNIAIAAGDAHWLYASLLPENSTNQKVHWTSSDERIVEVGWVVADSREGVLIANRPGTAVITAMSEDGRYTAQCRVTVEVGAETPTIVMEADPLRAGQTVRVRIGLKNNPGIASLKFTLDYEPDVLTLTDIVYNTAIGGQAQQPQNYQSPVILNWINGTSDSEGDFLFATLTFTVSADAVAGETTSISLTYDENDIYDISETNIYFHVPPFTATITDYIPGDINGDGTVNNKDLTRLFQYQSGWDVEVNESALDTNGDGAVNNKDLTRLFQYLSGWEVELH